MESDDELLAVLGDALERQINYQQQIGGNPLAREPGRFFLDVNPSQTRRSIY